jgi:hypothetical protein
LRGLDLNQRPLGYEPNELPDCSTPRLSGPQRAAGSHQSPDTIRPNGALSGAETRARTGMGFHPRDFKSLASASSAISAPVFRGSLRWQGGTAYFRRVNPSTSPRICFKRRRWDFGSKQQEKIFFQRLVSPNLYTVSPGFTKLSSSRAALSTAAGLAPYSLYSA